MKAWALALVVGMIGAGNAAAQDCYETAQVVGLNAEAGGLLNVRTGPGREFSAVAQVRLGDVVQACGFSDEWTQIVYANGAEGWVSGRFLAPIDEGEGPTTQTLEVVAERPEWENAYSRRSFKLGMPISVFKRHPHPDYADAYPVCSDDSRSTGMGYAESGLYSEPFRKAGMVRCAYFRDGQSSYSTMPQAAGVGLGDDSVQTSFYFINPDGEEGKYLFWIATRGPTGSFGGLVTSFRTALGEPTTTNTELWQNRAGATFDNDILTWNNEISQIRFQRYGDTINVFDLEHSLLPLMEALNRRLEEQAVSAADRL